jgi:hypothetical protein
MQGRFDHDAVEDTAHTLHRPGCPKIKTGDLEEHPTGSASVGTGGCRHRRPDVAMVL